MAPYGSGTPGAASTATRWCWGPDTDASLNLTMTPMGGGQQRQQCLCPRQGWGRDASGSTEWRVQVGKRRTADSDGGSLIQRTVVVA
ncbi:hypothetical protein NDU88_007159 [Pleurodeles waltl]|uniref:Uncharacterized protein n=1 Tax=Pleurodeles waltl TaxID=8319 RepID=A0AAV7N1C1_PLEWA|nr:hypothetical protein NDU88_007159 [Pleurodeles waltl]